MSNKYEYSIYTSPLNFPCNNVCKRKHLECFSDCIKNPNCKNHIYNVKKFRKYGKSK